VSVYCTLCITAADARKRLMIKLLEANDEELEAMMDKVGEDALYNFRVVSDYDDLEYGHKYKGQV